MLLAAVAAASAAATATPKRSLKIAALADALGRCGREELPVVVAYLSGVLRQSRTGVGPAALRELPPAAAEPTLTVLQVDAALERIAQVSGPGSQGRRAGDVYTLFGQATAEEQRLLRGLLTGDLRQGALEGLMVEAVAAASGVPVPAVRRAAMLAGDLQRVAVAALTGGQAALGEFRLEVGRPLQPMLAASAGTVEAAMQGVDEVAVDWKLDGVRVQVHRDGSDVAVFTRSLDDITGRVPEVVETALALEVESAVLDGEAIALRPDGRPRPFQETGGRIGARLDVEAARRAAPLSTYVFDVLHLDGEDVLDRPARERFAALASTVPAAHQVPRIVTGDQVEAGRFFEQTLAAGHEGVVVKDLGSPYEAGRRRSGWVKVKPHHTLDLVVLAAEWGHGRRRGWLSNLHLGARDESSGELVMLGKTFKGLTDAMLVWQTARLQELAANEPDWGVRVRPELVVEVAFDGVQSSPRYPAGVALRFARVLRHRPDKSAAEADTLATVLALHARSA